MKAKKSMQNLARLFFGFVSMWELCVYLDEFISFDAVKFILK